MTKAAHQVVEAISSGPSDGLNERRVPLPSTGVPVTVGVSYDCETKHLVFSFNGKSGGALSWQSGGYALVINFSWSNQPFPELFAITPACWFANKVVNGSETSQICCIPPIPGTYHIAATVPDPVHGMKIIDPKIIVTPIVP